MPQPSIQSSVLVDITEPIAGRVKDGLPNEPDTEFSSEAAMASVSWDGFYDPESGIDRYITTFIRKHDSM